LLKQGDPVEPLVGEDGTVFGYYDAKGVYTSRRERYIGRKGLEFDATEVAIPPIWHQVVWNDLSIDDVLEFEECCAQDEQWRQSQALRERAEAMLRPALFRDVDPPGVVTAYTAIRVVDSNNRRAI